MDVFGIIFSLNVFRNKIHGTRPVQGDTGDHVLQILGFQFLHEAFHTRALELEHAVCMAGSQGSQHFFIIVIDRVHVNGHAGLSLDLLLGILDDRQGTKPQEIHFQKTQLLQSRHRKLGDDRSVVCPGKGHILVHSLLADDHARRVHGGMSRKSLESFCHIDEVFHFLVAVIELLKLGIALQRLVDRDIKLVGDHFRDGIHSCIGQIHNTAHIPDHTPGRQRTESDDLYHLVFSVFPHHIVDDLLAPFKAEIHVDIGHGHPLRVQETLKEQVITDRVQFRDAE